MKTSSTIHVLLVEDSPTDVLLTENALASSRFQIQSCERLAEALKMLSDGHFDIVLLDLGLPDSQGLETLRTLRGQNPRVPVVVLTGRSDEESALQALQEGAQDYLVKGQVQSDVLGRSIRYAIERNQSERALRERARLALLNADVGLAFAGSGTLHDVLRLCVESMVLNLDAAFARIWTLNQAENVLELQASAGIYTHIDGPHGRVPVGKYKIGRIAEEKKPHLTNDVAHDPWVSDPEWARREGMLAFAGYPLLLEDRLVGVMAIFARKNLSDTTLQAMGAVANQISLGIENKQTELRLAQLLLSSPAVIFSLALDREPIRVSWISDNIKSLMGYEVEECLHADWWTPRVHPVDLPRVTDRWPALLQNGRSTREFRFRDKAGIFHWLRDELRLLRDAEGKPKECVGSWSDVTEHMRAEGRELAQHAVTRTLAESPSLQEASAQILRALCECLEWDLGGLWSVDRSAELLRWVQTWHRPAEPFAEFVAASKQSTFAPGIGLPGRVWANRRAVWIPDVAEDANLPRGPIAVKSGLHGGFGFPITLGNEVLGVLDFFSKDSMQPDEDLLNMLTAVGSQIGQFIERKQAEESLRETNQELRTLIQAAPLAIISLDLQGSVQAWNPAAERLFGWQADEVLGQAAPYVPPEKTDEFQTLFRNQLKGQGVIGFETQRLRKDGARVDVRVSTATLHDTDGKIVGILSLFADFTEQKRAEERFLQAQKMEAFGQLAGGVAHDFNNLLTIISGYSEILLSTLTSGDPMREIVKTISEAAERAAALTRQLLAFSRKSVLDPKVLDLNEVVQTTEKLLRRLIGEDILLTAVLDPTISRVKVDPDQLGQVLMNLAVNARDAMPRGGKLTVQTCNVELDQEYAQVRTGAQPGGYVLLSITDTGSGMTAEVKARLFEPFFTTKGLGKGTGLGLAVVQGIVKQSGGHVEVYSEPDIGTNFKIYLPAMREPVSAPNGINTGNIERGTESVLVVEDEDAVRGLAVLALQTYGYKVLMASNGKEALRLVDKHQGGIDLLVTDVVMPGMGGPDLAEALRPRFPRMKVLFCSGYTDDAVVRHGLLHENVAFLQKPYTPLSLVRKVRQVFDAK